MKKKTVLGYGWKLSTERYGFVLTQYFDIDDLFRTEKAARKEIAYNVKNELVSKTAKPKVFKVVVEDV